MAKTEQITALQEYYLHEYNDVFWIILRLGGCVLQQQLCRLLNKGQTDTTANTLFVHKLTEAQLLKIKKIGSNNLLVITYPVMLYFGINRIVEINGTKVKRSAMILEKYLKSGCCSLPLIKLKERMDKTSALYFYTIGENHLRLIRKYIPVLQAKGWNVDGLRYEAIILTKRYNEQKNIINDDDMADTNVYEFNNKYIVNNKSDIDLYNLECQNAFLSGIRLKCNEDNNENLEVHMDIFNIHEKDAITIAKLAIDVQRVMLGIFSDYKNSKIPTVYVKIYSHESYNNKYEEQVYSYLCSQPEYIGNDESARKFITLYFFDSKATLFSNICPKNIR